MPQAGSTVRDAHQSTSADIAPGFVALPPSLSRSAATVVFIARLAVHDRFWWLLHPHSCKAIRHVITHVSGLAGLKVKPIRVLVLVVAVVRSVMDSGWLVICVPGVDLLAAGRYLWLRPGPITTRQVDGGPGAEARYG